MWECILNIRKDDSKLMYFIVMKLAADHVNVTV